MPTYITADDVRRRSGAPTSLISDADIEGFIDLVEEEMERWMNTKFAPTQRIDHLDGSATSKIFVDKNPLLSVRSVKSNDTTITPGYLHIYRESGKVELGIDAETPQFIAKAKDTWIKYLFGMVVESSTSTTSSAAVSIGTSVSVEVAASASFTVNDWVDIYGMDGKKETAQISTIPDGTHVVLDQLVYDHESGSVVVKLEIPGFIKAYMEIEAALSVAINAVGSTYTFNASYSLGDLSVVKGVPYTHWRESVEKLLKERNMRKSRIRPRPYMAVS